MTLASNVYDDTEDKEAAILIVKDIMANGRKPKGTTTNQQGNISISNVPLSSQESPAPLSMERVPHNVAMRLRDKDKKFSGELGESWMEFVDEYLQVCRDYSLSPSRKLQYLHNLLSGDAKRFYLDKVDGIATTFQHAVQLINDEYNSHVRQTRIKDYLNTLRVSTFVEKGLTASDSLSKV